jgi:hypothetical protein
MFKIEARQDRSGACADLSGLGSCWAARMNFS